MPALKKKYHFVETLGSGTWGTVFKAEDEQGNVLAIKKLLGKDAINSGLDFSGLREVKYLRDAKSPNIIQLKDVYLEHQLLHLVMEYCPTDLEKVIRNTSIFISPSDTKCYFKQILSGMEFCHSHFILHRDLKPSNLLINSHGLLKLADFGLARSFGTPVAMTSKVITSGYRPPELLYGSKYYSAAVDIWSVGCIFLEIVTRTPVFPGETDVQQLTKIFALLGTPTEDTWPDVASLPHYIPFEPQESLIPPTPISNIPVEENVELLQYIRKMYNATTSLGKLFKNYQPPQNIYFIMFVIMSCLQLNPLHRCTAKSALESQYFATDPPPTVPNLLKLPFIATAPVTKPGNGGGSAGLDDDGNSSGEEAPPPPVFSSSDEEDGDIVSKKRKHE